MRYFVICEYHGEKLNSVRGPYTSVDDAYDHLDKCKAFRKERPTPFPVLFTVQDTFPPEYIG